MSEIKVDSSGQQVQPSMITHFGDGSTPLTNRDVSADLAKLDIALSALRDAITQASPNNKTLKYLYDQLNAVKGTPYAASSITLSGSCGCHGGRGLPACGWQNTEQHLFRRQDGERGCKFLDQDRLRFYCGQLHLPVPVYRLRRICGHSDKQVYRRRVGMEQLLLSQDEFLQSFRECSQRCLLLPIRCRSVEW